LCWLNTTSTTIACPAGGTDAFLPELVARTGGDLFGERGSQRLRQVFERIVTEFRTRLCADLRARGVARDGWHTIERDRLRHRLFSRAFAGGHEIDEEAG
jgi:hypothetical protein